MNNFYYLSHGGPGSGRYPLGSGDRPYQKFEGSRRKSSGISGYIRSRKEKKAEAQRQKVIAEDKKRSELEEREKKRLEKDKERVLREGSATEVMKYQGKITNAELSNAIERIRLEKQLQAYADKEIKTALDRMKRLQEYTKVSSKLASDGVSLWNSFAAIYNSTSEGKNKPLVFIGKGNNPKEPKEKK